MHKFTLEEEFKFTLGADGELQLTLPKRKLRESDVTTINNGIEFAKILSADKPAAIAEAPQPAVEAAQSLQSLASASAQMQPLPVEPAKRQKKQWNTIAKGVYELDRNGMRIQDIRERGTVDYPINFCFVYSGTPIDTNELTARKFKGWAYAEGTTRYNSHYVYASLQSPTRPGYADLIVEHYNSFVSDDSKKIKPAVSFDYGSSILVMPDRDEKRDEVQVTRYIDEHKAAAHPAYWSWKPALGK